MRTGAIALSIGKSHRFLKSSKSIGLNNGNGRAGHKMRSRTRHEKLWRDLIADTSKWWDNRSGKPNVKCPDFTHKRSGQSLWLTDSRNPSWVAAEIAFKAPVVSGLAWVQMLSEFNSTRRYEKTLEYFERMHQQGIVADGYVFVHVLKACAALKVLQEGRRIHRQILETGCELNVFVSSSLVDMYAKCGSIDEAWTVFDKMPTRNVVSWSTMILGCVKCGEALKALELFQQMLQSGVEPNSVTYVGLLNACARIGALEEGRRLHEHIIRSGFDFHIHVSSCLIDMYAKCGSIEEASGVFDEMPHRNVVAWTAMIMGYVKCGKPLKALQLFRLMQTKGLEPNSFTFVGLLNACARIAALDEGRNVHKQIIQCDLESDIYVGTSLVEMYSNCGSVDEAWKVFNKIPSADVVAWTTMILGFVKCGEGLKGLKLFRQMQEKGIEPDSHTFVIALNACASVAAFEEGRCIHKQIIRSGCESDIHVGNSLIDMYAKCGSIDMARALFNNMSKRNVVTWTAMIMGYAMHGLAKDALDVFEQMFRAGSEMNEVTFISLLSACSHGGLVKKGKEYFESMWPVYGVSPIQEHYTCMVDILGRAGHLDDAEALVMTMPLEPCAATWRSLLGACRIHGNVEMGLRASKRVLELDPMHAAGYVLLSNMFAAEVHQENNAIVQKQRKEKHIRQPGRSWIEVNNEVHTFVANGSQHPQILKIHEELKWLSESMKEAGYVPDTRIAFHDTEAEIMVHGTERNTMVNDTEDKTSIQNKEETTVDRLFVHSEKLAIAFGLISTPAGTPIRIAKNFQVCGDCHTATKFISKIVARPITLRDATRFHHFKNGLCSCGDY